MRRHHALVFAAVLLLVPAATHTARAAAPQQSQQAAPTTGAAVRRDRPAIKLDIPALPKSEVTLEVDAMDEDLLGLVKSLNLQGIPLTEALGDITHLRLMSYKWLTPETSPVANVSEFYEAAFRKEGARRNLFQSNAGSKITMLTFDRPRKHFALIIEKPTEVMIARTDGYPDLEKLGPILNGLFPGVMRGARGAGQ